MILYDSIREMKKNQNHYDAARFLSEWEYAEQVSRVNGGAFDQCVAEAAETVFAMYKRDGVITRQTAAEGERILMPVSGAAKKIRLYCVSHAHIDMNWMWSYNETVAITLDTFRTVLRLMEEYPDFVFSQSQTSTYRIVEENDPALFEEIRRRVKEGRWEVTASAWVEADKNMSDGESLARHLLYTKQYFAEKFGLGDSDLSLDFEPDTFGHNASMPEILAQGGVKYYYHCRGQNQHTIYNWEAKTGRKVLVYCEPDWYNAQITPDFIVPYPAACRDNGIDCMPKVYGVGDHGGGPTRRDIEALMDMASWPVAPTLQFATYRSFFEELAKSRDSFPCVRGELNYVFTGCYSSQSRIKTANRTAENQLFLSEGVSALSAAFCGGNNYNRNFRKAWQNTLFNQFHDIVTGSGVRETREYAMGIFQESLGYAYAAKSAALDCLAQKIDTSSAGGLFDPKSFSEGGGVGFTGKSESNSSITGSFDTLIPERGNGLVRILHLFNVTQYLREAPVEVTLWDYDGDIGNLEVTDDQNGMLRFAVVGNGEYWAHRYHRILVYARIQPFGYATCIFRPADNRVLSSRFGRQFGEQPRVERYEENILENEWLRARFDTSMNLTELTDKASGKALIRDKSAFFKLVMQNSQCVTVMPGNAWVEGYPMLETSLNDTQPVMVTARKKAGDLRQSIDYRIPFRQSAIRVSVSLDANAKFLRFEIDCDWYERYSREEGIPALKFCVPFSYDAESYRYKIPFGYIDRPSENHDVPSICFGYAPGSEPGEGRPARGLGLAADTVYAFRGEGRMLETTLVRGSQYPDSSPEYGLIKKTAGIAVCDNRCQEMEEISSAFAFPILYFSNRAHEGTLPMSGSFLHTEGNIRISALKLPEDQTDALIVRAYDISGEGTSGALCFSREIREAKCLTINEKPSGGMLKISGEKAIFELKANEIITIKVQF